MAVTSSCQGGCGVSWAGRRSLPCGGTALSGSTCGKCPAKAPHPNDSEMHATSGDCRGVKGLSQNACQSAFALMHYDTRCSDDRCYRLVPCGGNRLAPPLPPSATNDTRLRGKIVCLPGGLVRRRGGGGGDLLHSPCPIDSLVVGRPGPNCPARTFGTNGHVRPKPGQAQRSLVAKCGPTSGKGPQMVRCGHAT